MTEQQFAAPPAPPAPAAQTPEPKKKPKKGLIIGGSIAAGLLLIVGIASASGAGDRDTPTAGDTSASQPSEPAEDARIEVPNLVGMSVAEARTALEAEGLTLTVADGIADDAIVQSQAVASGDKVDAGSAVSVVAEAPAPQLTMGQEQAVAKAKSYLNYSAFSRSGLIDQLVFEGFSTEDATFAVDFVAPDWNAQAAEKAQSYLDYSAFSRQGLIDQLLFEGFTQEQAEFGVAAVGF